MPRHLKTKADNSAKNAASIDVSTIVKQVIDTIRRDGDAAVRRYSEQFDRWSPPSFKLSQEAIDAAIAAVPRQTIEDTRRCNPMYELSLLRNGNRSMTLRLRFSLVFISGKGTIHWMLSAPISLEAVTPFLHLPT